MLQNTKIQLFLLYGDDILSFADELRKAEKRMKAQIEQEAQKTQKKRRVAKKSPSGSSGRSAVAVGGDWERADDIIAMYLYVTDGSKFFRENYSKKRKVAVSAMERRMAAFGDLIKGKAAEAITEQMRNVYQEFRAYSHPDLQQVVIKILRGEHDGRRSLTLEDTTTAASESVVKRR